MFDNIDELIEVNMKLLYTSKSHYMMRINFKDEYGFNLKNSKAFADILVKKGLIVLESSQGFRCDLTDLGREIYQNGGWMKYVQASEPFQETQTGNISGCQTKLNKKLLLRRKLIASIITLIVCLFISMITIQLLHRQ